MNRNRTGGVYTGNKAQQAIAQRRLDNKPRPKLDDPALMLEIIRLFKGDLSADQISGRLGVLYPDQPEKQVSPSTIPASTGNRRKSRAERAFPAKTGKTAQAQGGKRPSRKVLLTRDTAGQDRGGFERGRSLRLQAHTRAGAEHPDGGRQEIRGAQEPVLSSYTEHLLRPSVPLRGVGA